MTTKFQSMATTKRQTTSRTPVFLLFLRVRRAQSQNRPTKANNLSLPSTHQSSRLFHALHKKTSTLGKHVIRRPGADNHCPQGGCVLRLWGSLSWDCYVPRHANPHIPQAPTLPRASRRLCLISMRVWQCRQPSSRRWDRMAGTC